MARTELDHREGAYRQALGQLYTLACYAYGDSAAAQRALDAVLSAYRPAPGATEEQFLLLGMQRIFERGMALGCCPGVPCGAPEADRVIRLLDGLDFEQRMTLLLYGRHGMPAGHIAQVMGKDEAHVRRVLAAASSRFFGTNPSGLL